MNVLLLEDEPDVLQTLRQALRLSFPTFVIETASSAEEAEARIASGFSPGLIVCDVRLPGKGGVEFLLEVQERLSEVKFILISGYGPPPGLAKVDHRRVLRFLQKPFDMSDLVAEIQEVYMRDQFSGQHRSITFIDIVQVLNMANRTAKVEVRLPDTNEAGELWLVGGEIHHAVLGELEGVAAWEALYARPDAVFKVQADATPPRRTIEESFTLLLLAAMADDEA